MEDAAIKVFAGLGACGLLTIASLLGIRKVYRDAQVERKEHHDEMLVLLERYISQAQTMVDKYYELQKRMTDLFNAVLENMKGKQ